MHHRLVAAVALARGRGPPRPATDAAGVVEDAGEPVAVDRVSDDRVDSLLERVESRAVEVAELQLSEQKTA